MTLLHEFMTSLAVVGTASVPEEPVDGEEEGNAPVNASSVDIVDDNARVCPTRRVSWNESFGRKSIQITMDNARMPTLKIRIQGRLANSTDKQTGDDDSNVVRLVARSLSYDTFTYSKMGGGSAPRSRPPTTFLSVNSDGRIPRSWPQSTKVLQRQLYQVTRPLSHDDIKKSDRRWGQCHRSASNASSSSSSGRGNAIWGAPMRPPSRLQSPLGKAAGNVSNNTDDLDKGQNLVDTIRILSLRAAMTLTNNDGPCWQTDDQNGEATTAQNETERVPEAA